MRNILIYIFASIFFFANPAFSRVNSTGSPTNVVTRSGSLTSGNCVQATTNNQIVTTGSPCGSGGGGTSDFGTSTTSTNPQVSGDATSGFYTPGASGGIIALATNGHELMEWTDSLFGNYFQMDATNGSINVSAQGTQSDISINFQPKGLGALLLKNDTLAYFDDNNQNYIFGPSSFNTSNISGGLNVGVGYNALSLNQSGSNNTAIGQTALVLNSTGSMNVALGNGAMQNNDTGDENASLGFETLFSNTTGSLNVALGATAMYSNITGTGNMSIGLASMYNITSGNFNTAIGVGALQNVHDGGNNISLGFETGNSIVSGNHNIIIGDSIDVPGGDASNQMNIGGGIFGLNMGNIGGTQSIGLGESAPVTGLDINNTAIRIENSHTPASSSESCATGTISWDTSYIYVCVSTNTWTRSLLTTF